MALASMQLEMDERRNGMEWVVGAQRLLVA
jgi:hypothetical protein